MADKVIVWDRDELVDLIETEISQNGLHCDLNHLDVSRVTDMYRLFYMSDFQGDISQWNVSNVINMEGLFPPHQIQWRHFPVGRIQCHQYERDVSK